MRLDYTQRKSNQTQKIWVLLGTCKTGTLFSCSNISLALSSLSVDAPKSVGKGVISDISLRTLNDTRSFHGEGAQQNCSCSWRSDQFKLGFVLKTCKILDRIAALIIHLDHDVVVYHVGTRLVTKRGCIQS